MAETVNPQVTDAVTQSNVKVLGDAPAMAMGTLFQTLAHSTGLMFENGVTAQQQQNTLAQAAANQGVMQLYSLQAIDDALLLDGLEGHDKPDTVPPAKGGS